LLGKGGKMDVVIIGAGLAGLGAAWKLQSKNLNISILEKESRPGGLCRTERENKFLFDYTGHLLHFKDPIFKEIVFSQIEGSLDQKIRDAWIWSKNVYTRYPFQANLFGLPIDVIIDCIYEYSKQHFSEKKLTYTDFNEWILGNFGEGIANHFMIPYNKKVYKRHPVELHPDCNGRFLPQSDLRLLLRGALSQDIGDLGYNAKFYYPKTNGIETLVKSLSKQFKISLNERVVTIDPGNSMINTSQGRSIHFDYLISSQPLPELVSSIKGDLVFHIGECVKKLKHVSILNVNLGIKGYVGEKHWVYVPEEQYAFHRIGFPHNFSINNVPDGFSSVYLEISYDPSTGINKCEAIENCITDCMKIGILRNREDLAVVNVIDIPFGYVVFDHNRDSVVNIIQSCLESAKIYTAGRFGSWVYSSMEDAFMDGYNKAEKVFQMCSNV
jgi:protoporphyrinogen oxidase